MLFKNLFYSHLPFFVPLTAMQTIIQGVPNFFGSGGEDQKSVYAAKFRFDTTNAGRITGHFCHAHKCSIAYVLLGCIR